MSARREELTRVAARLFAERGYQGTSLADLAEALGMQKPSLYHHIDAKEDLLWEIAWDGAEAFHAGLDGVPADAPAPERIRLALRAHLAVVAGQLDIATVFVREWRYLEGERRERFVAERRALRGADSGSLPRGRRGSELRTDLDVATAALALPLGRELGLHLAAARRGHRPPRRPSLRRPAGRHARLRDARLTLGPGPWHARSVRRALLIVNPYSTHVTGDRARAWRTRCARTFDLSTRVHQAPRARDGAGVRRPRRAPSTRSSLSGDGTYNEALNGADAGDGAVRVPARRRDERALARARAAPRPGPRLPGGRPVRPSGRTAPRRTAGRGERPPLLLLRRDRLRCGGGPAASTRLAGRDAAGAPARAISLFMRAVAVYAA